MFLKLVVVLVVNWYCAARRGQVALRVYKGETASLEEFPFIVLIQQQNTNGPFVRQCTGSLIAETWVLTAAHCIFRYVEDPQNERIVRYGDFMLPANETKLYSKIIRVFVPTSVQITAQFWVDKPMKPGRDDIGMLMIERVPNKPRAKLLALDYRTLFGLPAKYAGFGLKVKSHLSPMKYRLNQDFLPLQMGDGVLVPCDNLRNYGLVICIEPKCSNRAQGDRPGDSGGPLVYDGRIIGVTKGPPSLTLPDSGGSFTPVSVYLEWIHNVMSSNG